MDRIFINGMSVFGKHGVYDEERTTSQEFIIDIAAYFDARPAAASDNLEDTVNYMPFADLVKESVEGQSFYLIERLAEHIADRILEDRHVERVEVTVRKPAAITNGQAGVTITRKRV